MEKNHDNDRSSEALLLVVLAILASLMVDKLLRWADAFYFNHLLEICLSGIALVSAGGLVLIRWRESKIPRLKTLKLAQRNQDSMYVGETFDGFEINLPNKVRTGHVQIVGATGRGKTESVILPWFMRDLLQGHSAILIDGKGDRELRNKIYQHADTLKRSVKLVTFDLGSLSTSATTNPLKLGTPQQITDRLFAAFEFEDPFYKGVQYDVAGSLIQLVHEVGGVVTFKEIYGLLTDDQLLAGLIAKGKSVGLKRKLIAYLAETKKERQQKMMGLISQLAPFAEGEISEVVNGQVPGKEEFSLSEMLTERNEQYGIIILLPTLLYQEIAFKLGKLFLQEIAFAVALRKHSRFTPIYLDEFSSFVYPGFSALLNKARSSCVALHLSHQSIADLEAVSLDFAKSVNTNTNVKCLLGLNDPMTADFYAKHLGTITEEKETQRAQEKGLFKTRSKTGDLSIREVEAYKIHPNELKNFTRGKGVIAFTLPVGVLIEKVQFGALSPVTGKEVV